jgi:uncharacterized protein YciI
MSEAGREPARRRELDGYTITFLIHAADGPELADDDRAELHQAHRLYRAALAEEGYLLASGSLADDDVSELSIFDADPRKACLLEEADPAVRAGMCTVWAVPWTVPAGSLTFSSALTGNRKPLESGLPAFGSSTLPSRF